MCVKTLHGQSSAGSELKKTNLMKEKQSMYTEERKSVEDQVNVRMEIDEHVRLWY